MFKTRDGFINIAANQQQQWEDLADELGLPELKTDPRFQERDTRKANRFLLTPLLEEKLVQQTTAHWVEVLNARGIPSGEVLSLQAALTSEQAEHRQVIADIEQPGIGPVKIFNMTAKFSKTPAQIEMPPPRLSEHTGAILGELGYDAEAVKALKEKQVI
jgi:CoA:oxalate CoA-transferase